MIHEDIARNRHVTVGRQDRYYPILPNYNYSHYIAFLPLSSFGRTLGICAGGWDIVGKNSIDMAGFVRDHGSYRQAVTYRVYIRSTTT